MIHWILFSLGVGPYTPFLIVAFPIILAILLRRVKPPFS